VDSGQQPPQQGEQPRAEWTVPVLDAVRRDPKKPIDLIVAVSDSRVVVIPPSAAGYVVPHTSIERYCNALRAADNVAEYRKTLQRMDRQ
jgi:hypothetical protein